ncbi:ankyrin repeat domain-containing protein [Pedobacter sp. SD-b]|uniref:Ankyrin repeat domain-containing protein n=1 Tax=Pedobacter segetis TaxID=2793069 RepID=A0ABS1BHZ3_9SPHI|nr:ankyrin repeat domain-containing protein [Pedobacter segetis]MBK0382503.1 ankyrin repeat domain-containing protein [Pedobacter segetis]
MLPNDLEELIIKDDENALRDLLNKDSSLLKLQTSHGVSPLMLSCYFHKANATKVILEFSKDINLFEASASGKFDEVAHLLFTDPEKINDYSEDGFTALGLACYFGKEEVARYLVLKGADVNLPSNNGFNVFPLHSAIAINNLSIAKMLIENHALINVSQSSGVTPLHSAAQNGNVELIILLLEKGAKVDNRMEGGKLPADLANEKGFTEIADILSA